MLTRLRCWLGRHSYWPVFEEWGSYRQFGARRWRMRCRHCEKPTRFMSRAQRDRFVEAHGVAW
jgi:hypothetical protein